MPPFSTSDEQPLFSLRDGTNTDIALDDPSTLRMAPFRRPSPETTIKNDGGKLIAVNASFRTYIQASYSKLAAAGCANHFVPGLFVRAT